MATTETPEEKAKREERAKRDEQDRIRSEQEAKARAEREARAREEQERFAAEQALRNRYAARVELIRAHGTPEELQKAIDALTPTTSAIQERL